jgi:transposase
MTSRSKIKVKEVASQQTVLFPSCIVDRIPENHPVRIVNDIITNNSDRDNYLARSLAALVKQ